MALRVGISAFAGDKGLSGISQYLKSILSGFARAARDSDVTFIVYMGPGDEGFLPQGLPRVRYHTASRAFFHPVANVAWHQTVLPVRAKLDRLDVLFLPAGNRRMSIKAPCPVVTTVHDLSPFHVSAKYDPARMAYVTHVLPWMIRQADRVVSVSESTKKDLVELAGVPADRVKVIYHGIDHERFHPRDKDASRQRAARALGIDTPFLLYLSRLEHPGKNHVRLIRAFEAVSRAVGDRPHHLVLAGADWSGAEQVHQAARQSPVSSRILFPGFIPTELMTDLLRGAEAMIFPSLFEGFGFPVLEAMACGTPVAASNCSSLPELVGSAGLLFDPHDPDDIAGAIQRLVEGDELRQQLAQQGLERVAEFTWEKASRATLDEIRRAAVALSPGAPRGGPAA